MEMVAILIPILQGAFHWNRARVQFLAHFLVALLQVKNVNFTEIATAFATKAKIESNYKRIQRFFRSFAIDFAVIAWAIAKMLPLGDVPWVLTLDRTNWKFGKRNINILVLGIAYRGIAFPILWVLLPKRGNSNTGERIALMNRFLTVFSIGKIQCLTADREFLGQEWFSYLLEMNISFRIRIRENMYIANSTGIATKAKILFRHLAIGESQILDGRRLVDGSLVYVIGLRLVDEYLILVTDREPEGALEDYARRWEIETLFSCLKSRGFRFEETHLTELERVEKLVAILGIALAFAHITGEWQHERKAIRIKSHGRKERSFFRRGLDYLRRAVLNFALHRKDFIAACRLLYNAWHRSPSLDSCHSATDTDNAGVSQ